MTAVSLGYLDFDEFAIYTQNLKIRCLVAGNTVPSAPLARLSQPLIDMDL
jgi:hypothetical protein